MQIFDFIDQDQIDNLPDDDESAFTEFVRIARSRFQDRTSSLDENNEYEWRLLEDARLGFVNVVISAAKDFHIEPFATMDVPKVGQLGSDEYRQFVTDIDHYMTQIILRTRRRSRNETVGLSSEAKSSIRSRLHHLREAVNNAQCDEDIRTRLQEKLDAFEKDLNSNRINYLAITRLAFEILAAPGALAGSYEIATKLMSQIIQTVDIEKNAQERHRLPPVEKPAALMPPRAEEKKKSVADFGSGFSRDLEDEIPF